MNDRQPDEERIFHVARAIADDQPRNEYLDHVCGGDQGLRERVEALLQTHENEQSFLASNSSVVETAAHTSSTERPGTSIGHYKLMEQIGEGGMGTVYVAQQDKPIRRKVALKVIKPGMDSKAVIARFEAERQALAMMDHPNIAKVLDAGTTTSGRPYFAMELVKGVPITEYCDRNKLTIRERLRLFIQVCQAIQHAHQKGIIHRDIKPSNVLVTLHDGKPVPKVIDFGVAKALNARLTDKTIYTAHFQVVGTLLYMSPEQAELSGLDVDTRSDIYSLGVLLYELLTGTTPFQKSDLDQAGFDEQRRIIRDQEPPRASVRISSLGKTATTIAESRQTDARKLSQLVRKDLDWIVLKSLEKDRTRRYDTAVSFAEDVKKYLEDEPVEARPPSLQYRTMKFVKRNRFSVGVASLIVLLLGSGVAGIVWQWRQTQTAIKEKDEILNNLTDSQFDRGMTAALADQDVKEIVTFLEERGDNRRARVLKIFADYTRWSTAGQDNLVNEAREATNEFPDDISIRALYSMCLDGAGLSSEYWHESQELLPMLGETNSLETDLFIAKALQLSPDAIQLVDRAVKQRFSPYAMVIRARVHANHIHQTGILDDAEETLRNLIATQQIDLTKSELGRIDSLATALELAATARNKGRTALEADAMSEASRIVKMARNLDRKLTHWDQYYIGCYEYLRGDSESALEWMSKCARQSSYFSSAYQALAFELDRKLEEGLLVEGPLGDFARAARMIAVNASPGDLSEAERLAKQLVAEGKENRWIWSELSGLMILAWLNHESLPSHAGSIAERRAGRTLHALDNWILDTLISNYLRRGYSQERRDRILENLKRDNCDFPELYRMLAQLVFGIESLGRYRASQDVVDLREAVACLEDCAEHRIIYYPLHKWGRALSQRYRSELNRRENSRD